MRLLIPLVLLTTSVSAQISLVKDICKIKDASAAGTNAANLTVMNGTLYYTGSSDAGVELWKSNGLAGGATLVKDIYPGTASSKPEQLTVSGNVLYFLALDGIAGRQLWRTDGTASETVHVFSRANLGDQSSEISNLTAINGGLYFLTPAANHPDNSNYADLWYTDSTVAGARLIKNDVSPAGDRSFPISIAALNGYAYFSGFQADTGFELWRTDGTVAGTTLVKNIVAGTANSQPNAFIPYNGKLYFRIFNSDFNAELWTTDGSPAGTMKVKDFSGTGTIAISNLVVVNNSMMFFATDGSSKTLFKSDGTTAGTVKVMQNVNFGYSNRAVEFNNELYFTWVRGVAGNFVNELWKSDGTLAGTVAIKQLTSGVTFQYDLPVEVNNELFFMDSDGTLSQIWKTNGTSAGTVKVTSLSYTNMFTVEPPGRLTAYNNHLYFTGEHNNSGNELWRTNGTPGNLEQVSDHPDGNYGAELAYFTELNGVAVFAAGDENVALELWRSDGTTGGTYPVKDIYPGPPYNSSSPRNLVNMNNKVYFTALAPSLGVELWVTDGTPSGTAIVKDIASNSASSQITDLTAIDDKLYFSAYETATGFEPWISDGTPSGTMMLKDIAAGSGYSRPVSFTALNGSVYFGTFQGLWKTDGTSAGTVLVKDAWVTSVTASGGKIYFTVYTSSPASGYSLWVSNGTAAGTTHLQDFASVDLTRGYHTRLQDVLYFIADDGVHGNEVWQTDGTSAGTALLKDLTPGAGSGIWADVGGPILVSMDDKLFFNGRTDAHGSELWMSDGTAEGTELLKEIFPGAGSSIPGHMIVHDKVIYFSAYDGINRSLWKTSGIDCGTVRVDAVSDVDVSQYNNMLLVGNTIFMAATDRSTGYELYVHDITTGTPIAPGCLVTGVDEAGQPDISVYPTRVSDHVHVTNESLIRQLEIVSIDGRLMYHTKAGIDSTLDVRGLAKGLYLIRITTRGNQVVVKKIVKQ